MGLGGFRRVAREMPLPLLLAVFALAFDEANRHVHFSLVGTALLDEPAHLATAALGLLALTPVLPLSRPFVLGALVGSVAIDLDHLPLRAGMKWVAVGDDGRPFTHSLVTVSAVAVAAWLWRSRRELLAGAAVGVVLHFARDVVEGPPGVPLLWPFDDHGWMAGHAAYVGLIICFLVVRAVLLVWRRAGPGEPTEPPSRALVLGRWQRSVRPM